MLKRFASDRNLPDRNVSARSSSSHLNPDDVNAINNIERHIVEMQVNNYEEFMNIDSTSEGDDDLGGHDGAIVIHNDTDLSESEGNMSDDSGSE